MKQASDAYCRQSSYTAKLVEPNFFYKGTGFLVCNATIHEQYKK